MNIFVRVTPLRSRCGSETYNLEKLCWQRKANASFHLQSFYEIHHSILTIT